ncbi:hypothetical protein [Thalassospira sp. CH_XMU1458]
MRLTALAGRMEMPEFDDLDQVLAAYEARDADRARIWLRHFGI